MSRRYGRLLQASSGRSTRSGSQRADRELRPHLTLARVRRRANAAARRAIAEAVAALDPPPPHAFRAAEIVLFRSQLGPDGARYEALERFPGRVRSPELTAYSGGFYSRLDGHRFSVHKPTHTRTMHARDGRASRDMSGCSPDPCSLQR